MLAPLVALSIGSVDAGFLKDQIESAVLSKLPHGTVFETSEIRASLGFGTLLVDVRGIRFSTPDQGEIEVDSFKTHLGLLSLLSGRPRPVAAEADGLVVRVAAVPRMTEPTGARMDHIRSASASLNAALGRMERAFRAQGLQSVAIRAATIDATWLSDGPFAENMPFGVETFQWQISESGSRVDAELLAEEGNWTVTLDTSADGTGRDTHIRVSGLPPSVLLPRLRNPDKRPNLNARADAQISIASDEAGAFENAAFDVSFGAGHLSLMRRDRTAIDSAGLTVSLASAGDRLDVSRLSVASGGNEVSLSASFQMSEFGRPITFAVRLDKGRLAGMNANEEPVRLETGHARGTIEPGFGRIVLQEAVVSGPEGTASLNGEFRAAGPDAGLTGSLQVGETSARMVYALWPPIVARQARNWFRDNVQAGLAGPGRIDIAVPARFLGPQGRDVQLPPDAMVGEIPISAAQFTPTPKLPAVRTSSGAVRFADATIIAHLDEGEVTAVGVGTARIGRSDFRVPELGKPRAVGYLDLRMAGSAAVLAQLSNAGPLSIAADRGLVPADLHGDGQLELFAEIPLGNPAIRREDVRADFALQLTDFGSRKPLSGGRRIAHADLRLSGTTDAFTIRGDAVIDGIPAEIEIASSNGPGPQAARLTLDEEARRQLGIDMGPFVSGPVIALLDPASASLEDVSLDLTPTDINLPFLGWQKKPGVPARLDARVRKGPDGTDVSRVHLTGEGFRASGELSIGADGRLISLDARNIRLQEEDDFNISVRRNGSRLAVRVSGEAIDLRGMMAALQNPDAPEPTDPPEIDLRFVVDRLIGHNDVVIDEATGTAALSGGKVDTLSAKAGADAAYSVEIADDPQSGERVLTARLANAGGILRFLNIYRTAYGGSMTVKFTSPAGNVDGNGHVGIYGFRVREGDRNITVRKMSIPFSRTDQSIGIGNATMAADGLDATARGSVNLESRYISIRGTIVPTNGLNRLPAAIPVLGDLLGARKRKGLIGIAFTLAGPLSSPELKLNVASAVTPGFVRNIFGNGK